MHKPVVFEMPRRAAAGMAAVALMTVGWLLVVSPLAAAVYPTQPAKRGGLLCVTAPGITCFTAQTMEKRWDALPDVRTFEPVVTSSAVIAGSTTGLHVLNAADGSPRWHWRTGYDVFSPAVDSNVVYAADRAGHVAAIGLDDGEVSWERQFDGWLYTPALVADLVITGGRSGVVHALNRDTGETVWTRALSQELVFRPVAVGDGVVVTTFDGSVVRLDQNGRIQWRMRDPTPSFSPTVAEDLLLFGGMDGVLRARDSLTGRLRWRVELSGRLDVPARVHGNRAAVVTPDGVLVVVATADGSVLVRRSVAGVPLGGPVRLRNTAWRVLQRHSGIISWVDAS